MVYRPGRENARADALSRNPPSRASEEPDELETQVYQVCDDAHDGISRLLEEQPQEWNECDFHEQQAKDPVLKRIIDYLEDGTLPDHDKDAQKVVSLALHCAVVDKVLYFVDSKKSAAWKKRAAVPRHLQTRILQENHGGVFAGHFSGARLYGALSRHWWWETMYKDAISYCRNCTSCAVVSGTGRKHRPLLHPIPVQRPFQIMGVDIMELPLTERQNRYVVVFQDFLTKWPMVFPVPDQKSIRIARLLAEEVVPLCGVPESLLSDRGTNLLSNVMKDTCALLGVAKLNTTAAEVVQPVAWALSHRAEEGP